MKNGRRPPTPAQLVVGLPKDYRPVARAALDAGWTISRSGNGHTKLTHPDGRSVPLPGSSRARNLHKAILSQLRKMGVEV